MAARSGPNLNGASSSVEFKSKGANTLKRRINEIRRLSIQGGIVFDKKT